MEGKIRLGVLVLVLGLAILTLPRGAARAEDPLVEEGAKVRVEQQYVNFLSRTRQISRDDLLARNRNLQARDRALKQQVSRMPREMQQSFWQTVTNRYEVLIPPLQQQWNEEAARLQREQKELTDARNRELEDDAKRAAALEAERTSLPRWVQQGTLTDGDARARDASAQAEIGALQNKYTSYGGNWIATFNRRMNQLTTQMISLQKAMNAPPPREAAPPPRAPAPRVVETAQPARPMTSAGLSATPASAPPAIPKASSKLSNEAIDGAKRYALLFGSNEFRNYPALANPVPDAQALAETLSTMYGFKTEVVKNATYAEMRTKLVEYRDQTKVHFGPGDELLVFFAGHGKFDEETLEGYVIAKDSIKDDAPRPAFAFAELEGLLDHIPVPHLLLILDVCHGGAFDKLIAEADDRSAESGAVPTKKLIAQRLRYRSRLYLAAGGNEYVPDGNPGNNSPFVRKILGALRTRGGANAMLTFEGLNTALEDLIPTPRSGPFGHHEPGGTFIFVSDD